MDNEITRADNKFAEYVMELDYSSIGPVSYTHLGSVKEVQMKLHASGEDYLETILVLQKKLSIVPVSYTHLVPR